MRTLTLGSAEGTRAWQVCLTSFSTIYSGVPYKFLNLLWSCIHETIGNVHFCDAGCGRRCDVIRVSS